MSSRRDSLTADDLHALHGLLYAGHAYISASEHNMALSLCERGYAEAWMTIGGFAAWRITDKGKKCLPNAHLPAPINKKEE